MTSIIKVDQIQLADGTAPTAADLGFAAGSVIETLSTQVTSQTIITTANTWTDVGLSLSITPSFASSKILVIYSAQSIAINTQYIGTRLLRDSTVISRNWAYNNQTMWMLHHAGIVDLDDPATTSSVTYKIQAQITNSGGDLYHSYNGPDNGVASLTLIEIAG